MEVVSGLRDRFLHWARPLHRKLRRQKVELFLRIVRDSSMEDTLLDVGGGPGIDGEFLGLYSSFSRVVAVNLDTQQFQVPTGIHVKKVKADGCDLPFESESFDWVFSNAVIEHSFPSSHTPFCLSTNSCPLGFNEDWRPILPVISNNTKKLICCRPNKCKSFFLKRG